MNRIIKRLAVPLSAAAVLGTAGFAYMASNTVSTSLRRPRHGDRVRLHRLPMCTTRCTKHGQCSRWARPVRAVARNFASWRLPKRHQLRLVQGHAPTTQVSRRSPLHARRDASRRRPRHQLRRGRQRSLDLLMLTPVSPFSAIKADGRRLRRCRGRSDELTSGSWVGSIRTLPTEQLEDGLLQMPCERSDARSPRGSVVSVAPRDGVGLAIVGLSPDGARWNYLAPAAVGGPDLVRGH